MTVSFERIPAGLATFLRASIAIALATAATSCARRDLIDSPDQADGVSVPVESLWKKEAAEDPITAYRIRIALDPENPGLHNNLGNQYVLQNMMAEALREFRTAARLDRESPVPWNNIGTTYKKLGKLSAAAGAFKKALRVDERYALAWYNLGTVYDENGKYDAALEYYLKALALKPELAQPEVNPQIVENRNQIVVRLRHYLEEAGNIALPLDRLPEK